jgi:hypothetical protein
MQLNKVNFRDLDRKWIIFDNKKDIKKIYKSLNLKFLDGILLGYVFISHENGIQIRILGNISKFDNNLNLNEEIVNKKLILPYEITFKYNIVKLDEDIVKKILGTSDIEYEYDCLYERVAINSSREITEIDEFRHEEYIDDVELLLNGKKQEYLWARIEDCSKQKMIFVCSLLDSSKYNKNYKKNVLVLAKIEKNKKTNKFVIDGIVDRVKK